MAKRVTKTEKKLIDRLGEKPRTHYRGVREYDAAKKLEDKGLVKVMRCDGRYKYTRYDGSWGWGYYPQGYIQQLQTKNKA